MFRFTIKSVKAKFYAAIKTELWSFTAKKLSKTANSNVLAGKIIVHAVVSNKVLQNSTG